MQVGALIVDDEEDIRTLMRIVIEAADKGLFVAGEATDGLEAVERADEVSPQVIVLDERMPGMNGLEAATIILRKRPGQPIILCSAHLDFELRERAEALGIGVCLTKNEIGHIPERLWEVVGDGR